jgi:hypothetical protein
VVVGNTIAFFVHHEHKWRGVDTTPCQRLLGSFFHRLVVFLFSKDSVATPASIVQKAIPQCLPNLGVTPHITIIKDHVISFYPNEPEGNPT